jgi:hypothetical protein
LRRVLHWWRRRLCERRVGTLNHLTSFSTFHHHRVVDRVDWRRWRKGAVTGVVVSFIIILIVVHWRRRWRALLVHHHVMICFIIR